MGELKVLPSQLANMIAAGEVVQRPASVVKEMMENAIDAGALKVDVIISDAGRTLIQIIDNGAGMTPGEAVLCFERHATSKISTQEDLQQIMTYGFRGEALASIAAVADVNLKTRKRGSEVGTRVSTGPDGRMISGSTACPEGSNFEVRNLFYNTPARRKFLKSDNIEFKHIVEEFTRIAITRPEAGFSLTHNGKQVFQLKPDKSLKFRIANLMGASLSGELVDIEAQSSIAGISGFIGRPESARKTAGNQFFFVNGRYFRSPYLHKAVLKAYENLIPEGMVPSYFIFLETDPHSVDVNIHPTKAEVKFEDEAVLFQILSACIKEALGRNSYSQGLDFETEGSVELPQIGACYKEWRDPVAPVTELSEDYNPFDPLSGSSSPESRPQGGYGGYSPSYGIQRREDYGELFEQKAALSSRTMVLQGKYILSPAASGLMVINISRARQRILYERLLKAAKDSAYNAAQSSLFPIEVTVGKSGRLTLEANAHLLDSLGFTITMIAEDKVEVEAVPEGFNTDGASLQSLIPEIIEILDNEEGGSTIRELMDQNIAQRLSCMDASRYSMPSSGREAQRMIETLFACDNAEYTSDGRKIINIIKTEDIDKLF